MEWLGTVSATENLKIARGDFLSFGLNYQLAFSFLCLYFAIDACMSKDCFSTLTHEAAATL